MSEPCLRASRRLLSSWGSKAGDIVRGSGSGSDILARGGREGDWSGRSPARASCKKRTASPGSTRLGDGTGIRRSVWSLRRVERVGARHSGGRGTRRKWKQQQHPVVGSRGARPAWGRGTRRTRSRTCEPLILLFLSRHVHRGHPRGRTSGTCRPTAVRVSSVWGWTSWCVWTGSHTTGTNK